MATTSLGSALGSIATLPNLSHIHKQHDHVATTSSLSSSSTVRNHPSLFLGKRVSCQSRSVQVAKGGHAVRCFSTDPSERVRGGSSSSGRIIMTPFGPIFAPNYGTGRSDSNARREWERRNQGQDERRMRAQQQQQQERERYNRAMIAKQQQEMMRMRQMIQEQMMRGRRSAESSNSRSDMALLRELEQRLRAASGNQGVDQSSVDELVKEVEKRLRNAQGSGGAQPADSVRENR